MICPNKVWVKQSLLVAVGMIEMPNISLDQSFEKANRARGAISSDSS